MKLRMCLKKLHRDRLGSQWIRTSLLQVILFIGFIRLYSWCFFLIFFFLFNQLCWEVANFRPIVSHSVRFCSASCFIAIDYRDKWLEMIHCKQAIKNAVNVVGAGGSGCSLHHREPSNSVSIGTALAGSECTLNGSENQLTPIQLSSVQKKYLSGPPDSSKI